MAPCLVRPQTNSPQRSVQAGVRKANSMAGPWLPASARFREKQNEVITMRKCKQLSVPLVLGLCFVAIGSHRAEAKTPLKTINNPQGGIIVYGLVDGATNQAAAMSEVLRIVHKDCGDKPQVGRVFRVRGANSVAVYFSVVNRPQGNKPVAGLLLAAPSGPNQIEAALVSDDAARFGSTVNPMLSRLFSEWHPGEAAATPSAPADKNSPPASAPGAGGGVAIPPMHPATLPDNTASLSLPDGWNVTPQSGGGSAVVSGPRGERVIFNMWFRAQDPRSATFRRQQQMGIKAPHLVVYTNNVDLVKACPDIWQRLRASNGLDPAPLRIDHAEPVPASQGQRCVNVTGQLDPDGKGMVEWNALLCITAPDQYGSFSFVVSQYQIPLGSTEQQRATAAAIMSSYKVDTDLVAARSQAEMAPVLASMRQSWEAQQRAAVARSQQISAGIRQIGANATARMNSIQQANDAQHAGYWAQQDSNARNGQGFSNYLLDQTVIQDNNMHGNGTIGHGTVWNGTADALVKADPQRFEMVDTPNFWKGVDY
jgi:hypothetical protein